MKRLWSAALAVGFVHLALIVPAFEFLSLHPRSVPVAVFDLVTVNAAKASLREPVPPKPTRLPTPVPVEPASTVVPTEPSQAAPLDSKPASPVEKTSAAPAAPPSPPPETDYLPQATVSVLPRLPTNDILARIHYPDKAKRLELQGTVILDLYIDQSGEVRRVEVVKDPGHGFAEEAVKALVGLIGTPAQAAGKPVAVKFRFPVRFTLK